MGFCAMPLRCCPHYWRHQHRPVPINETTLVWLAVVVLATGIGAFFGYNVSLVRNGPVLTSASLTLTPAFAAVQAMTPIGHRLAWYHDLGARPEA
jgi:drug/metabolite transporter (DMT)-like permease